MTELAGQVLDKTKHPVSAVLEYASFLKCAVEFKETESKHFEDVRKLSISHLPLSFDKDELKTLLECFGALSEFDVAGTEAFVKYADADRAENAVASLNDSKFHEATIIVQVARPKMDASKRFACDCIVKGEKYKGFGKTKKDAKTEAGRIAFCKLFNLGDEEYIEEPLDSRLPLFICPLCAKVSADIPSIKSHLMQNHQVPEERLQHLLDMVTTQDPRTQGEPM